MPTIHVYTIEGKTVEQKRQLVRRMTDVVMEVFKVPRESVTIIIQDMPAQNYATAGTLRIDS